MRCRVILGLGATMIAAGCGDGPAAPERVGMGASGTVAAGVVSTPPCTHHWAAAGNGSWFDASKWSPNAVPGALDVACLDVAGTYTVTMDPVVDATPVSVAAILISASSGTQTLSLAGSDVQLDVTQGIDIGITGKLSYDEFGVGRVNAGGSVLNAGIISHTNGAGTTELNADITNSGTITIAGIQTWGKVNGAYVNNGTITLTNGTGLVIPAAASNATFQQNGGTITTALLPTLEMRAGTFTLNGGSLPLSAQSTLPIVRLNGANLVLGAGLSGPQDIAVASTTTGTSSITGDVPAGTNLWIVGHGAPSSGSITWSGSPTVAGSVRFDTYFFTALQLTLNGNGVLTNNGAMSERLGNGTELHLNMDVSNHGTVNFPGATFVERVGGVFDNYGAITGASASVLTVSAGATFRSRDTGTFVSGQLRVSGGTLTGTGSVPHVVVQNNGTVAPGAPVGTLTAAVVDVSSGSGTLAIEVNGTQAGSFDQLVVQGQVNYGGVLNILTGPGMASCSQVLDIITDNSSGGRGTFSAVTGLNPGPGRYWRLYNPSGKMALIGFDQTTKVQASPTSMSLSEGGPSSAYSVCLSQAPTANVTVNVLPDAQVTALPAPLTFTTANWMLPQTVTVNAVDDAVVEPPHLGNVHHTVSSTDAFFNAFVPATVVANITDNDGSADLSVGISQAPPPLTLNQVFTVGFRVTNNGPTLSTGATVTIQPGVGFQYQGAVGAACTGSGGGLTCVVPGMASGAQATFTMTLKAAQRGVFQKTITVTGQNPDPNAANNTIVRNVTVN